MLALSWPTIRFGLSALGTKSRTPWIFVFTKEMLSFSKEIEVLSINEN